MEAPISPSSLLSTASVLWPRLCHGRGRHHRSGDGRRDFANFNVDAIQEVQSSSGVMPAAIGHGAAGYTNVITKSGTNQLHGSAFEFVRNSAFDARNFLTGRTLWIHGASRLLSATNSVSPWAGP